MKYLALDIDGVLATIAAWDNPGYRYGVSEEFYRPALALFEDFLIHHTDVHIVLSSVWRKLPDFSARIKKESTLVHSRIVGVTPSLEGHRGDEIKGWEASTGNKVFAILDDSTDVCPDQLGIFVKVMNPDYGVSEEEILRLSELYNGAI